MVPVEALRNIGILAHIDAGKTTLTERVLFYSGVISLMGEVHEGTATTDWMNQEQERGITITAASIACQWKGAHINLIDTPGHVDFTVEVERSLRVLDGAVAVVSAVDGVQSQTETVWRQARNHDIPVLCFVNKMDREGADLHQVVADIEARLEALPVLCQFPLFDDEQFVGVVDLVRREAIRFAPEQKGAVWENSPIPEAMVEEAEIAREMLLDAILEDGDPLTDRYLLEGDLSAEEVLRSLSRAVISGRVVPVFCGAALKNIGVQPLLDAVVDLLPSPLQSPPERAESEGQWMELRPDTSGPFAAMVFKRVNDARHGSVTTLRVYSGTLASGQTVHNSRTGESFQLGRLVRMMANEPRDIDSVGPGDIASIVDMPIQATGDTICDPAMPLLLQPMQFPQPVAVVALEAATPDDSEVLEDAVKQLVQEDPTLRLSVDPNSGQLLVRGVGELQLEVLSERLRQEFRIHCRASQPRVSFLETVDGVSEATASFEKEVEGRVHKAGLTIRVLASERDAGLVVNWGDRLLGLRKDFIRSVEEGFRRGMKGGGEAGFDVVDLEVQILELNGEKDFFSELSFLQSSRLAMGKALKNSKMIRLEPQMRVEIVTPEDYMGPVVGDLNARRGKITQVLAKAKHQVIAATVPLSTMFGYASDLRSLTQGRASFTMQFHRYESISSSGKGTAQ